MRTAAAAAAAAAAGLNASKPHWLEEGASAFSSAELTAIGAQLLGRTVGEADHAGGLWLLSAAQNASVLDLVLHSFDIMHHPHHRVYVCMPASAAHSVAAGATTVVNASQQGAAAGKLQVCVCGRGGGGGGGQRSPAAGQSSCIPLLLARLLNPMLSPPAHPPTHPPTH